MPNQLAWSVAAAVLDAVGWRCLDEDLTVLDAAAGWAGVNVVPLLAPWFQWGGRSQLVLPTGARARNACESRGVATVDGAVR